MRRFGSVLFALALLAAACGDDDSADEPDGTDATTEESGDAETGGADAPEDGGEGGADTDADAEDAAPTPEELAEPGPYEVGVTTRELPTGNLVEIWYPATDDADGIEETYEVRTFTGPLVEGLVNDTDTEIDDTFTVEAARDAAASPDGPYPVVLFSHGFSAFRLQSSDLTRHLASWGMVVASADHPTRELAGQLTGSPPEEPASSADMIAALAVLDDAAGDPVLDGIADTTTVGLGGHSAGGGTVLAVAGGDEIDVAGYVSYASGSGSRDDTEPVLPDMPSLFMAGDLDAVVEPTRTMAAFEIAPSPSWYWEFADAGHLAFSDLCAIGGDGTLIDLAEAAGIGDFVPDSLRGLATDGCEEPNLPVQDVWPGVKQGSTGFYRWIFGIDADPIGLDEAVIDGVTIDAK